MDLQHGEDHVLIRLHRGEEIVEALQGYAREQKLPHGVVHAIGALGQVELGYFHVDEQRYQRQSYPGLYELVSLQGNLGWVEQEPFLHAHAVIGDADNRLYGGHLFRGVVTATAEVVIWPGSFRLQRAHDPQIGLKLWDLQSGKADEG